MSWRAILVFEVISMAKAKPLTLTIEDRELLESLIRARSIQASIMNRARIILLKADGESTDQIAKKVGLNRNSVLLCLKKFKEGGVANAIYDDETTFDNVSLKETLQASKETEEFNTPQETATQR